jgi:tetratricopeptide (TPR) repeat protein
VETDLGSREEIARRAEEATYGNFIRNLMFLPTVREIRQSVATMPGLNPPKLESVIANLATEWRRGGRRAEAQLLDYVKRLIDPFLPGPPPEKSSITGTQSMMAFLLRAPNALRMRTALVAHRELVNRDLLDAAYAELKGHDQSPPSKELCLAMYLIARAMDDPKEMVTGLLMWGAFCRRHQAVWHAERHFRQAAKLAKDLNDPATELMIIGSQVGLYRAMHRYQEACTELEEGLKLAEHEDNAPVVVSFADGLASCYRALGQTAKALDAVSRLIAVSDHFPGKKSRALNFRGLLYEDLGRYEIGAIDYAEAAKVAEAEGDRAEQFIAMNNAAASLLKRSMGREGYNAFQDILRQVEQWGNPLMVASTHNNLGHALSEMENYAAARAEFGKAWAAKINSYDSSGEVIALLGLGRCEEELGNLESAKNFFTLALVPALESQDASLIAQVQLTIADEKETDSDLEGTLESLRWTRDLTRDQAEPIFEALLVTRIAALLQKAGRIDEAIEECRALLQLRSGDSELMGRLSVSVKYANLLGSREESWPEAFELLLEQLKAVEKEMNETLIDARLGEISGSARPVYEALLELLSLPWARSVENRSPAAFGFDLHESAKARSLLAHLADAAALAPPEYVPAELRQIESALLAEERKWQEELVPSEGERHEKLDKIQEQLKNCWERMRPIAPDYVRARSAEPYQLEEILETLRATTTGNTAFVSFFVRTEATTCFVLRVDRDEPIMLSLPLSEKDLMYAARQLQRAFNGAPDEFPPYPPIRGDMPFKRRLDFFDKLSAAMSPLFASLNGVEQICVAPHGPLHMIPLHALQLPEGQYVGEKYAVVYTPSLSVALNKVRRATAASSSGGSKNRVFVAGVSSADDTHPEYFEGDAVLFDSANCELHTAIGVQGANRDAVISGLREKNCAVHISCHAYFNAWDPRSSGLILTNGRSKAPRDLWRLSFMDRQSYLVTVRDLMRINLDAELVTLSACSTGLQRQRNAGDELEGFARALLSAGAGSALLAMWNVDQSSSYELLSKFYRNWIELGMPKWKAMQAAQREFIGSGGNLRHPYHWAPFNLIGSWR